MEQDEYTRLQKEQFERSADAQDIATGESRLASQSSIETFEKIFTPTEKPDKFSKRHSKRDFSLTYTQNDKQRNFLSLMAELISALDHDHLKEVADIYDAERANYCALLRSHNFMQQRELTTSRHHIDRAVSGQKKKGLFQK